MFFGRNNELKLLNEAYEQDAFQFPVIYGRRRIGKTTLINEFCKGKRAIFFVAVQSTIKENLEIFSNQIYSVLAPDAPRNPFPSFREAIEYIFTRAKTERFILAIDEYPYLAASDAAVSSVLQAAIDKYQAESKLFLILCGSSMSFMERQVLGHQSPLYGRRTAQFKIQPFDYYESAQMLHGFNNTDKITLYGITGGVPEYLSRIDNALPIRENISSLYFNTAGRMFEEPYNLLKQELKMPETYNAIIAAISEGRSKLNEISTKVGIETSQCSKMLATLISLGIVRKEYPVTGEKSKKSIYLLEDSMFMFWYRFVQPDISRISAGLGETVCGEVFTGQLNSHTGRAFEECAKQYMWRALKESRLPFRIKKLGRWWGNNPAEKREEEIDIVALSEDATIFGECKWKNTQLGEDVLEDLKRKARLLPFAPNPAYILFSKSGFSAKLKREAAKQGNVFLTGVNGMFN